MTFDPVDPNVNFVELENKLLKWWYQKGIVKKYLARNKNSKPKFSFLDGPITANNPMGVHHAWGRTLKDLWQRFYNMRGFAGRFQNGFDEQGLWVEVEVEKDLGLKNKKDIENLVAGDKFASIAKFVNLCKARVKKFSRVQTQQSKRLGYFMDWQNSYHTSSEENNYAIWNFLAVCHKKGYVYKGRDSVPWCPRCGTAISQHEILTEEYKEVTHKAVFVKYKIQDTRDKRQECLLVWTTTPWTLLSNVAIAVNSDFDYLVIDRGEGILELGASTNQAHGIFIVAKDRAKAIFKDLEKDEIVKTIKGKDLVGLKYQGIFDDLPALAGIEHKIVGAKDLVTVEEGTGLVHIAPGAGEEDFRLARQENLPVVESIDESANYISGFGDFSGKNAKENPDLVIDELKKLGALFKAEDYTHRYPVCWRCKTELVFRVVDEWYIAMDRTTSRIIGTSRGKQKTLREQMIDVAAKIDWIPKWGLDRELDWLNNMHDWLISKKRYWGLALPIWECDKCGNFEVIGSRQELQEKAVEGWDEFSGNSPHKPWIDSLKIKCSKCGEKILRIPDVGNPWLDAGIVPFSTMPGNWFPADFITESFTGQFKNWFYSLIAMSTVLKNLPPVKTVLGHGSVKDEKGEEMHKSRGNAIEFNEAAEKIGVDVMRWFYLRTKPEHNVNFGFHTAEEIRRLFILRLWNVYVFFVTYARLDNWKPSVKKFKPANVLDRWIVSRLAGNIRNITNAFAGYQAWDAVGHAEIFIDDLSNWYVRRIRDRIGPSSPNGKEKDDVHQTLWMVLTKFSQVLAPIIPFLSEEIYKNLTSAESVHLSNWPEVELDLYDEKLEHQMDLARQIVELAHARRKEAKIKLRQPLKLAEVITQSLLSRQINNVIASEINVKNIKNKKGKQMAVKLDTKITPNLQAEGIARDLVRKIQQERKNLDCSLAEFVEVTLPDWPEKFTDYIMDETLTSRLAKGQTFKVIRKI